MPAATWARTGYFAFDTMTPVGPGTWEAARGAADAALTAGDLVAGGAPAAYACCRPPGHHVTRTAYGGSLLPQQRRDRRRRAARRRSAARSRSLDVDAHHGNGAQSIFYADADVLDGLRPRRPGAGWFPHFLGFAARPERAPARARTATCRSLRERRRGRGSRRWRSSRAGRAAAPRALVVALGVDAAAGDPESPLQVTRDGYRAAGRALGALGLPTVVVQEGGYDPDTIGDLVAATLAGLDDGISNGGDG